ncbi:carbohydrate kinase family protein [Halorubrum lacusprofundi]|jgi:ribokinase/sulfofructose kinase|uniref:PfkB domain protein n=1 Tax=Halorubrum lacusprofundi (strain ATCC 49239 / DSM 5036 / JCM 8891 / ACAM 34) TaxID=416348 RepID=B9LR40_HALLT|nr:carbohydrate kinase family protein [Halorubrum lacusprofundi]ACM57694.1 PfkB domain protein [Halorubrum lacusprofundi ATCC 49239]MCG1005710.1 carbohydrate kinase family protein [Halorubrum lacusprofundi]
MTDSPPVLAVGAAAIDEWYAVSNLPEPDGGAFASEVTTAFGGVGANVCVALDRLGREVGLVSRVGDDEYGRRAFEYLADTGVDASRVSVGNDPSTRSVILSDPAGERTIVTTGESFRRLRLNETDREALAAADIVFLTGYTPDAVSRAVLDTIESAADPPALVFDLSGSVEELVGRGTESETIHRYLHAADLFVADDVAAAAYFGGPDAAVDRVAAAQQAREANGRSPVTGDGWPRAVLTHGADGMTVVADGAVTEFDAFDVDVVDATGAGDSFVAGLIDRWIAGSDSGDDPRRERAGVADGVRFAAAVAAINCTSRFAQTGLPTRDDVEAFLAERGF